MMKTFSLKLSELDKRWILISADSIVLGRLAVIVANILRGKDKPSYTPHMDCGDYVVIINASKVALTGSKAGGTMHYRHTGYPGGVKEFTMGQLRDRNPSRLIKEAVRCMIPKGPLGYRQLSHLFCYDGEEHRHEAQNPQFLDVAALNKHNTLRCL